MKLIFSHKQKEAGDALSFFFRYPKPLLWKAGQYFICTLPHPNPDNRGIKRYFTIASAPFEEEIMLTTRINLPIASTFKKALYNLAQGESVEVEGPKGSFVVEDPTKEQVFIAGGIGITPYRAILLDVDHRKLPTGGTLLYANTTAEFVYQKELESLQKKHQSFQIHYLVEPTRITSESIQKFVPSLSRSIFYISGPPPMVDAVEQMVSQLHIPSARIKEDYFPGYDWP
ncbi:MAG: FAD-dependent oxidoreductase [Patescibacteria group bacterium]